MVSPVGDDFFGRGDLGSPVEKNKPTATTMFGKLKNYPTATVGDDALGVPLGGLMPYLLYL